MTKSIVYSLIAVTVGFIILGSFSGVIVSMAVTSFLGAFNINL